MIYISGAITGTTDFIERFAEAEDEMRLCGYLEVFNPTKLSFGDDLNHEQYMELCLTALEWCDFIYMIPGWKNSKGARMEYEFARENNICVLVRPGDD